MACRASEPRDDASLRDGRGRWWWGWLVLLWILRPSEARAEAPKVDGPAPLELSAGPPDDPVRLRLGASVWVRGEIHQQPETTWAVPQRTRVEAQARWRGLSSFVQIQDVRSWGTEPSTTSTPATTGLHQGYLELGGRRGAAEGFIRVGRQEHFLGSMRLIGTAPWNPNMRSFDAIRLRGSHGPFSIDVTGALVRAPGSFTITDEAGNERTLRYGAGGVLMAAFGVAAHEAIELEGYLLVHDQTPTPEAPTRDRVVISPGARVSGQPWRGLSYDLEGYVQTGRWDGRGHGAALGAATVGYRWAHRPNPRVEAGYVVATGSGCAPREDGVSCDRDLHRDFDGFFGARHRFLGIIDAFAPTNVHDAWLGLRVEPAAWAELRAEAHHFMLFDPTGRWLATNGSPAAIISRTCWNSGWSRPSAISAI